MKGVSRGWSESILVKDDPDSRLLRRPLNPTSNFVSVFSCDLYPGDKIMRQTINFELSYQTPMTNNFYYIKFRLALNSP